MANWIQGAVKRPGAFTRKAKSAGMGVQQYANQVLSDDSNASTLTKQQANFAKTMRGLKNVRPKGK
jgi:hypothetical protein